MSGPLAASWPSCSPESLSSRAESEHYLPVQLTELILVSSYVDQLNQILHYLGTPSEDTLRRVGSPRVRNIY